MKAKSYASSLTHKYRKQSRVKGARSYICGHLRAPVEGNRLLAITKIFLMFNIHVGQTRQILVGN